MPSSSWVFTFQSNSRALENPIGFKVLNDKAVGRQTDEQRTADSRRGGADNSRKIVEAMRDKAWTLAWSPLKTLGMNWLMLYFGGASAGIFTVLLISYAFLNGFKTLLSVNQVFEPLESAIERVAETSNSAGAAAAASRSASFSSTKLEPKEQSTNALAKFFFSPFLPHKLLFIVISGAITSYFVYHAASMGIIPLRTGDFLGFIPERKIVDRAFEMS